MKGRLNNSNHNVIEYYIQFEGEGNGSKNNSLNLNEAMYGGCEMKAG